MNCEGWRIGDFVKRNETGKESDVHVRYFYKLYRVKM